MQRSAILLASLVLFLWAQLSFAAAAPTVQPLTLQQESSGDPVSLGNIEAALTALIDQDSENTEGKGLLEAAKQNLELAATLRKQIEQRRTEERSVPARRDALQQQLQAPAPHGGIAIPPGATTEMLAGRLEQEQADLAQLREEKAAWKLASTQRTDRLALLPEEIARAKQEWTNLEEAQNALSPGDRLTPAGLELASRAQLQRVRLDLLQAERTSFEAVKSLDPMLSDRYQRQEAAAQERVQSLQALVATLKTEEAQAAAAAAVDQARRVEDRFPELATIAKRIEELAEMRAGQPDLDLIPLPQRIARANERIERTQKELQQVEERFKSVQRRMGVAGLTESVGRTLRRDFEWLPGEKDLSKREKRNRDRLTQTELEWIDIDEEREEIGDAGLAAEAWLASLRTPEDTPERNEELAELEPVVVSLHKRRRELQEQVIADLTTLRGLHTTQQQALKRLVDVSSRYRQYIESQILWIKSTQAVHTGGWNSLPQRTIDWLGCWMSPDTWSLVWHSAGQRGAQTIVVLLLATALWASRRFLKRKRSEMNQAAQSRSTDHMVLTLRSLVQSALIALPYPLLMWFAGVLFANIDPTALVEAKSSQASGALLAQGMGSALQEISGIWWTLLFLHGLVLKRGVAETQLRWTPEVTSLLRRHLVWFTPTVVTLAVLFRGMASQVTESPTGVVDVLDLSHTLGRLAFVGAMGTLAYWLYRLGHKDSPLWKIDSSVGKVAWWVRFHRLLTATCVLVPVGLIGMALLGYYYTALQLELSLRHSLAMGISLILLYSLLLRWLSITRWKIAIAQAREKVRQRLAAQEDSQGSESGTLPTFDESEVNLPNLDTQTRQLFRSAVVMTAVLGLYFIWASTLPALKGLDRVQLWPTFEVLEVHESKLPDLAETAPAGAEAAAAPSSTSALNPAGIVAPGLTSGSSAPATGGAETSGLPSSITLGDVALSILFLLLTIAATKNLPGLLEIALLQRLPLDSGSRYAITTLLRYLILIIGVSAISSALGVGWENIQWLVAALTFGLAFGLQEIFANFVSGLIILLERPVRVGDVVTVGTTEGIVTRLRMRATTVQDFDRRELLVPNKEFITSSVINWTLTDPIVRVICRVGVAYGSDVELVRKVLLSIAKANSYALESPSPMVVFRNFGDSTLDFELRVFVANRDHWPQLYDTINRAIDKEFRANGIEIAFPQRDLHIRSGLEVLGHQVSKESAEEKPQS